METAKIKHNNYMKDYYKNNNDYKKARLLYSKKYYYENKESISEKNKIENISEERKEVLRERRRKYRLKNKEILAKKKKEYYQSEEGKLKQRLSKQRQRARKKGGTITKEDFSNIVKNANNKCYWCKNNLNGVYHFDHYVPLSKGGGHSKDNIVISCPECNLKKGSKHPYEFAITKGSLF
jgi:5-methylcytosine-specific restriction endonuclease McrA